MIYNIAITFIPNIGCTLVRRLIDSFYTIENIFKATKKDLLSVNGLGEKMVNNILYTKTKAIDRAKKELDFIQKNNIKVLSILEKNYPGNLNECIDAPVLLYYKGTLDYPKHKFLGIVGSRNASAYGKFLCKNLLSQFANSKLVSISGLALGIDTMVHEESLANNIPTIAVVGHGLDTIYPKANTRLADKIASTGALVTEFPSTTTIHKSNFPKRNRIIAGLVDALLVLEAAQKSGALITANLANSYNREVFACPGRVSDLLSEGCNKLIFSNRAHLATSAYDINYIMGWEDSKINRASDINNEASKSIDTLNDTEKKIYKIISDGKQVHLNTITNSLNIDIGDILVSLLSLEFNTLINQLPGDVYILAD